MTSRNGKQTVRSSSGKKSALPDIHSICAEVLVERDLQLAFEKLDSLCKEIYQDEVRAKAISAKQNRDIVDTFANLGARFAGEGQRSDAALCFAITAHIAVYVPVLEGRVIPFLNQALEFSDFFNVDEDSRLAFEIGTVSRDLVLRGIPFEARNEPERTKYYEAGICYSLTASKWKGKQITFSVLETFIHGYNSAGERHSEAGRVQKAAYWFEQAAHLASAIPSRDIAYSLWYKAGVRNETIPEKSRCFISAFTLLQQTKTLDTTTDLRTFARRISTLTNIGSFFLSKKAAKAAPSLRETGAKCLLQAVAELKESRHAHQLHGSSAVMRSLLGTYYLEIDQPDYALMHFREAVTADRALKAEQPYVMEVREDLTEALTVMGACLETVAGKEPLERREQFLREAQGFFKEACAAYRDLFAITSPVDTEKRMDLHKLAQERAWDAGRMAIMRKDWDDAVSILESAVQFDAKLPNSLSRNPLQYTYEGIVRDLQYADSQQKKPGDSLPPVIDAHSKKQKPLKAKRT